MDLKIQGLESLLAALDQVGADTPTVVKQAAHQTAMRIQATAKQLAPVDTGQLRFSIETSSEIKGDEVEAKVFTNSDHAIFLEYGTGPKADDAPLNGQPKNPDDVPHTAKPFWVYRTEDGKFLTSKGQPPQPFMYPAAITHVPHVGQYFKLALQKLLAKAIARKMGGK